MDKSLIINELKKHLKIKTDTELAEFLEVKQPTIASWRKRNTIDYELIITKCNDVNANWLITGEGQMLKSEASIISDIEENASFINVVNEERSQFGTPTNQLEEKERAIIYLKKA